MRFKLNDISLKWVDLVLAGIEVGQSQYGWRQIHGSQKKIVISTRWLGEGTFQGILSQSFPDIHFSHHHALFIRMIMTDHQKPKKKKNPPKMT